MHPPKASSIPRSSSFERPRPRLLSHLVASVDLPLVILAAPAGYGKTTLLAQYARSTTRRVAWCRVAGVHEGPADVITRLAASLPELEALQRRDARTPPETLAQELATLLAAQKDGTDLIVDNVESEELARWLSRVADLLEEGHRLLLSCYTTANFRLARRLADGQVLILDANDLAFDAGETLAYLHSRGSALNPETLDHLAGWPAGLALSAHGMQRHADVDDLVRDALEALPARIAAELPALSPLEVWTVADASKLNPELPAGWLSTVQRAGLPVMALGGGSFRPHQLLIQVLDQQLQCDPQRAQSCRAVAARLAEGTGALERAVQLYLQAGDVEQTVRLAALLVPRYRDRGEHRLTRSLLESLPPLQLPPALQERLAWAQIETGAAAEGERQLEALHRAGLLSPSGFASLAMVRGRQGQSELQYSLAQEGLALLSEHEAPVPALFWPLAHAAIKLGRHPEAEAAADHFVRLAEQGDDRVRLAEAWQLQGLVLQRTRTDTVASGPLGRARRLYEELGWRARAGSLHLDELSMLVRQDSLDGVANQLRALEGAFGPEHAVTHGLRLWLLGTVERRSGQAEQAEFTLRQALETVWHSGLSPVHAGITLALADTLLQQGRVVEAADWLSYRDAGSELPLDRQLGRAVLTALVTGHPLEVPLEHIQAEPDTETRLRAVVLLAAQGMPAALQEARNAVARFPTALQHDYALRKRVAGTPAEAVLIIDPAAPLPHAAADDSASPVLRVTTLGDFQVFFGSDLLRIQLVKARELLVWLILHGSGSRDELVTALWDGSAEERHFDYFRVAVRCLRGALRDVLPAGLNPLPFASGRYRLSPDLHAVLDVHEPFKPTGLKPFLPGMETEWVTAYREQLNDRVLAVLLEQAAATSGAVAVDHYRQLLAADPLLASAHEGLIHTLLDSGETLRAKQALVAYRQMLNTEFGTDLPDQFLDRLPPDPALLL